MRSCAWFLLLFVPKYVLGQVQPLLDDDTQVICDLNKYVAWLRENEANLQKNVRLCRSELNQIRLDTAGWWGPVREEDIYDVMCSPSCLASDVAHMEAMEVSGCNCVELSTKNVNLEADFCSSNSGQIFSL